MSNSRLVSQNFIAALVTQLISWGLAFTVTMYLPRYAGAKPMGEMAVAGSFAAVFGVLVSLGTSSVLIKEIARDRSRAGDLLGAALLIRVPLSLVLGAAMYGIAYLLRFSPELMVFIVVAAAGMTFATINDALGSVLQGMENLTRQGIGILTDKFLLSTLVLVFIFTKQPLWTIAATGAVTAIVSCAVNLYNLRSILSFSFSIPKIVFMRQLVNDGLPFISLGVFATLYGQSDPFILHLLTNDQVAGWYAVALRLVGTTMFLPVAINSALTPTLSRLYARDTSKFADLARRMLTLSTTCAVPVALILLFAAGPILRLLNYPAGFEGSIPVLRIGGGASFLYYMTIIIGAVIVASDRQKHLVGICAKSMFIGVPCCFLFTYWGHRYFQNGAAGAILSDTVMEAYIFTALLRVLSDIISLREMMTLIGKLVLAAVPMILLLCWAASSKSPFTSTNGLLMIVPGLLLYLLLSLRLRCIDAQEYLALLRGVLQQRNSARSA